MEEINEYTKKYLYKQSTVNLNYLIPGNITFLVCKAGYTMKKLYYQGRKKAAYISVVVSFMRLLIADLIEGKMFKTNNISTLYFYVKQIEAKKYKRLMKLYSETVWFKDLDLIANDFNIADFFVRTKLNGQNRIFRLDVQRPDRKKLIEKLNAGKRYFKR